MLAHIWFSFTDTPCQKWTSLWVRSVSHGRDHGEGMHIHHLNYSALPWYEQRKLMLSQDPLACMSAFRIIARLAMSTIFGACVCLYRARCNFCMGNWHAKTFFVQLPLAKVVSLEGWMPVYGAFRTKKNGFYTFNGCCGPNV